MANNTTTDMVCPDSYDTVDMCSWQFISKTIILILIIVAIILGNSLVITAVFLYQKLRKSISNFFIASLACADLALGIIILPFSLALEVMGYWIFGDVTCKIWLVVDVWVCTASILHLCVISMDRYIAIAYPLRYPNLMTHRRCRIICFSMWILSFIICFPALVDWEPHASMDAMNESALVNDSITIDPLPQCSVVSSNSLGYVVYSAMGSFFIPSFIMSGFYIKIFLLAQQFMKQSRTGAISTSTENGHSLRVHRGGVSRHGPHMSLQQSYEKHRLITPSPISESNVDSHFNNIADGDDGISLRLNTDNENPSRQSSVKSKRTVDHHQLLAGTVNRRSSRLNVGHTINKETRAAKTVAIIVGCFILCWTPFFICYLIQGVQKAIRIDQKLFTFFIWIGYVNSLFNPCIYAYFSTDYRHAFKKILRCEVKSSVSRRQGMVKYIASFYVSSSSARNERTISRTQRLLNALDQR